jgi:hypothetical protein
MNRCFLLLVDGLRPDIAETRLAAGDLPHLQAMVASGGRSIAITGFPSTTSVAYLPFLTGCAPGRCDIPSIRWMDRSAYTGRWWRDRAALRSYCGYQAAMLDRDLSAEVRTVFELVPESVGIFTPVARGLDRQRDPSRLERQIWGSVAHVAMWHQPSDESVSRHLLRAAEGNWKFVFAQFPAVDGYTHQSGHNSEKVHRALRRVDATVGELRRRLQRRGELVRTLILLVSDHGASPVHTHLDLADWFRARGVPTLAHPVIWERNPRAAVMVAGNGSAMVYAQPTRARRQRWPIERLRDPQSFGVERDLITDLLQEPAVALLAAKSEAGDIWVGSSHGSAQVRSSSGQITYQPTTGDPLRLGGTWSGSSRDSLERSWNSPYPDAPFHLLDQFRSGRSGDLLVIAHEGYDFRARFEFPEHREGHGSLIRAHMQTPVWSSAPLPERPLRTVDLFPSMLHWLGVQLPDQLDGELLWRPSHGDPRTLPSDVARGADSRHPELVGGRTEPARIPV